MPTWNTSSRGIRRLYETAADYKGQQVTRRYKTLKELSDATGQERNSKLVDYDIFVKASAPDPADPQHLYNPEDFDFRLKPGSAAVDAGVSLPTINDGFSGRAPDLGAYELDRPAPHYGPRDWPAGAPQAGSPRSVAGPPTGIR